jgi:hypothetical protein
MGNHWPLFASLALLSAAVGLGYLQSEAAREAARPQPLPPSPTRSATLIHRATEAPAAAPVPPAQPAQPAPAAPAATPDAAKPARAKPRFVTPAPAEAPAQVVQPATPAPAPAAAAAPPPAPAPRMTDAKAQILAELRDMLKTQLGQLPLDLNNGGYKFSREGALMEVQMPPAWSVTIYNVNIPKPEVETDDFKILYTGATTVLGINTQQNPVVSGNGKSYLRTASRMGNIVLERDPGNGNLCIIRPAQSAAAEQPAPPRRTAPATVPAATPPAPGATPPAPRKPADPSF